MRIEETWKRKEAEVSCQGSSMSPKGIWTFLSLFWKLCIDLAMDHTPFQVLGSPGSNQK